jgi:hypothetical protein
VAPRWGPGKHSTDVPARGETSVKIGRQSKSGDSLNRTIGLMRSSWPYSHLAILIMAVTPTPRRVLEKMQNQLAQMTAAHVAAEEHLSKLTVDEASVEKVVRDTPM